MNKHYSDDEDFVRRWNGSGPHSRHILVVDEFGNTGPSHRSETKFGYGVSDVKDLDGYRRIARDNRNEHHNDEQKANKTSMRERILTSMKIRETGTKTSCVYIDKDAPTPAYMRYGRKKRIYGVLNDTLDETLPEKGVVWVVIDNNTQYGSDNMIKTICRAHSNKRLTVYGNQYSSRGTSLPSDLLQTNDFVANAARTKAEVGYPLMSRILRMRFVRIGDGTRTETKSKGRMVKPKRKIMRR